MIAHLWVKGTVAPIEYIEMCLCREFGWTLTELRRESVKDVVNFLAMLDAEHTVAESRKKITRKR